MKHYSLNNIIAFGKFQGETIRDIYQFQPSYIMWLIEYDQEFHVDFRDFDKLPIPTPFNTKYKLNFFDSNENVVKNAKEYIRKGGVIEGKPYSFSDKIKSILSSKEKGNYIAPKYKSTDQQLIDNPDAWF
jgi:hypothetical protein